MTRLFAATLLLVAPLSSAAEQPALHTEFEQVMTAIVEAMPGLVVTSKTRSAADQARLEAQGYAPHRHSQHQIGLAWDLVGSAEDLRIVEERARESGLVPLRMRSPVTGRAYLHVQRFERSPLLDLDDETVAALVAAVSEPRPVATARADEGVDAPEPEDPWDVGATPVEEPMVVPQPVGVAGFEFPRRLLARKASGRIVLRLEINESGEVEDLHIEESDLPAFDSFVARQVKRWQFTPFLQQGRAVAATARLPIPIHIN